MCQANSKRLPSFLFCYFPALSALPSISSSSNIDGQKEQKQLGFIAVKTSQVQTALQQTGPFKNLPFGKGTVPFISNLANVPKLGGLCLALFLIESKKQPEPSDACQTVRV